LLNSALTTHGSSFLQFDQKSAVGLEVLGIRRARSMKNILRLYDPVSKTTTWQFEFPLKTVVSLLGDDEVVAVQPDGHVHRIDIASGQSTEMESFSFKQKGAFIEKYLLADDDRIYLIANWSDSGGQSFGESLASIRMNGVVFAWSREDNKLLWQKTVKQQNLVIDRFAKMPVLLFVSRTWKPRGRMQVSTLNIAAIHKQSGHMLMPDTKIPSVYSGFHALSINAEEPSIELKSYNVRMRLIPTDGPVAEATPKPPETPQN
jgi:hypothetical protein